MLISAYQKRIHQSMHGADVFEEYRKRIGKYAGVKYPDMKLLDMVIWLKGKAKGNE